MPSRTGKRRGLGQHYLSDPSVIDQIVELAHIGPGELVLEIGTGRGALTQKLCTVATRVEAFEVDRQNYLATNSLGLENLTLHLEDAFLRRRDFDVLVSSLPYSESANFVEWLAQTRYSRGVVVVQRDFAQKLVADPGDARYRAISVISQLSSEVGFEREIAKGSFDPPPRVVSALLAIRFERVLPRAQIQLIKKLFSQRRKKLGSGLKSLELQLEDEDSLSSRRVETLSPNEIYRIVTQVRPLQTI